MTRHAGCSRQDSTLPFVGFVLGYLHFKRRKDLLQFFFVKAPSDVYLAVFAEMAKDTGLF